MTEPDEQSMAALQQRYLPRFESGLQSFLSGQRSIAGELEAQQRLFDALDYAALGGGKRLRPMLVYLAAHTLELQRGTAPRESTLAAADAAAIAIELLHCYSLVHDDLPAMDDDALRRGKPSCHVQFGEASAILAGDALQAMAFAALADSESPALREQLQALAGAAGVLGMVGGQAVDLAAVGNTLTLEQLIAMHRLKTGALIECAVDLGALCSGADNDSRTALQRYAASLGLAFQVRDDVLDVKGSPEQTGKPRGADQHLNKPTFTSLLGLQQAETFATDTVQQAIAALAPLAPHGRPLESLASYVANRDR